MCCGWAISHAVLEARRARSVAGWLARPAMRLSRKGLTNSEADDSQKL